QDRPIRITPQGFSAAKRAASPEVSSGPDTLRMQAFTLSRHHDASCPGFLDRLTERGRFGPFRECAHPQAVEHAFRAEVCPLNALGSAMIKLRRRCGHP